jgi:hypothetical protein
MGFRSDLGCSVAINKAKSVEASAGVLCTVPGVLSIL